METCTICMESNHLVPLVCSHQFCQRCLDRWRTVSTSCPLCRCEIIEQTRSELIRNGLELHDSETKTINISVPSPKGTSLPISNEEYDLIRDIFGDFSNRIYYLNIQNLDSGTKIMFQNYKNNSWWFGIIENVTDEKIIIRNSIFLQRYDGTIYNSSPSTRELDYDNNDHIHIIY